MSPASDPLALLSTTTADDLRWGHFPWLGLGLGLAAIIGIGLLLQWTETEKPLARLRAEVQRLARGDLSKLDDHAYPGKFGGIARDVNAAMERFTLAQPPRSETARKDLDAILGPAPGQPASVFDLPQSHFGPLSPAPTQAPAFPGPGLGSAPNLRPPGGNGSSLPAPSFPPPSGGRFKENTPPPFPVASFGASPPPRPAARPSAGGTPGPTLQARSEAALAAIDPRGPSTAVMGSPSAHALASTLPTGGMEAAIEDDGLLDEDGYDLHVRVVYQDYVRTRESCGEPLGSLTEERFRAKLDANRQQLVTKYGCRSARFSVYVKDGKAAIKATPVR